jgi:transposase
MAPCLIGMGACVGAHHLSRKLKALGHNARLMPAKYVRPYSKGQKNDFRDAERRGGTTMPLDDAGIEQPLEPALRRALLESGNVLKNW